MALQESCTYQEDIQVCHHDDHVSDFHLRTERIKHRATCTTLELWCTGILAVLYGFAAIPNTMSYDPYFTLVIYSLLTRLVEVFFFALLVVDIYIRLLSRKQHQNMELNMPIRFPAHQNVQDRFADSSSTNSSISSKDNITTSSHKHQRLSTPLLMFSHLPEHNTNQKQHNRESDVHANVHNNLTYPIHIQPQGITPSDVSSNTKFSTICTPTMHDTVNIHLQTSHNNGPSASRQGNTDSNHQYVPPNYISKHQKLSRQASKHFQHNMNYKTKLSKKQDNHTNRDNNNRNHSDIPTRNQQPFKINSRHNAVQTSNVSNRSPNDATTVDITHPTTTKKFEEPSTISRAESTTSSTYKSVGLATEYISI